MECDIVMKHPGIAYSNIHIDGVIWVVNQDTVVSSHHITNQARIQSTADRSANASSFPRGED